MSWILGALIFALVKCLSRTGTGKGVLHTEAAEIKFPVQGDLQLC